MKKTLITLCILLIVTIHIGFKGMFIEDDGKKSMLAAQLGLTAKAADLLLDKIETYGDVATCVSLAIGVVGGAGIVTASCIAITKKMVVKYGRVKAAAW